MAEHKVKLSLPHEIEVGITDVVFRVSSGGRHVGTLRVSKGAVDFTRAGSRKRRRLRWEDFADLMEYGHVVKQKPISPRRRLRG